MPKKPPPSNRPSLSEMPPGMPEYYADQFMMAVNAWGTALVFLKQDIVVAGRDQKPGKAILQGQASIRMSLEHAKVMTMIMRRVLKKWESENLEIGITQEAYKALDLAPTDW